VGGGHFDRDIAQPQAIKLYNKIKSVLKSSASQNVCGSCSGGGGGGGGSVGLGFEMLRFRAVLIIKVH